MRQIQRRHLIGSRWTSNTPVAEGERHVEVIEVRGDTLALRAILTNRRFELALDALRDEVAWTPGWTQL
jgi:tryptophan-rich hypothetical protein